MSSLAAATDDRSCLLPVPASDGLRRERVREGNVDIVVKLSTLFALEPNSRHCDVPVLVHNFRG